MKKTKISIPEEAFDTINTKYPADSARVSNDSFTAGTKNLETSVNGDITKRKGGVTYSDLPTPPRDQYEAIFSDGAHHLLTVDNGTLRYSTGDGIANVALAGLAATLNNEFATTQDRVYFSNGITQKVYDRTTLYGGVPYLFPTNTIKNIGAIAPTSAPTVAVAAGGAIPIGAYTYKVTFLYYDFEESNGGLSSTVATTTAGNQTVNLTAIPVGGYGVTARKVYRDLNSDGIYVLVGVIPNNTTVTFADTLAAGFTPIPDDQGLPPSFTLISLYLDRLFVSGILGDPYTIAFSAVGTPDIYPAFNTIECNQEDPITGTVVYLDRLIVFNRRSMGQILGHTSDSFRYASIQGSVGCVDNRSIQTRVIDGVPILVWLSDKGFYAYNGNSVVYISDVIEDLINSNIQQALIQKGKRTQSDYTSFSQGVKSDGINIESNPGTILTKGPYWDTGAHPAATLDEQTNPKKVWDTKAEWIAGTTKTNIALESSNSIKVPTRFAPTLASGSLSGTATVVGSTVKLPTVADRDLFLQKMLKPYVFEGPIPYIYGALIGNSFTYGDGSEWGQRFTVEASGVLSSLNIFLPQLVPPNAANQYSIEIRNEISSNPGGTLWATTYTTSVAVGQYAEFIPTNSQTYNPNLNVTAGNYWLVIKMVTPQIMDFWPVLSPLETAPGPVRIRYGGNWVDPATLYFFSNQYKATILSGLTTRTADEVRGIPFFIKFTQTPIPSTGQWLSPIHDTFSTSITPSLTIGHTGTYVNGTFYSGLTTVGSTTTVEGSDIFNFSGGPETTSIVTNLNGSQAVTPALSKRYWRVRVQLNSSDSRVTPIVGTPTLKFTQIGLWESEVIDTTLDSTVYDSFTQTYVAPVGTSAIFKVATSASPVGPWTFVTFGSHVVRQYMKVQATLTTDITNGLTPEITAIGTTWTLISSFESEKIDTGVTPSGWDVFQASYIENGGSVTFYMRSATTSGGLNAQPYVQVYSGDFPDSSILPKQWVQWKAILTAHADQLPSISSVAVSWFIGNNKSIRCASLFFNKNYYVALAELESLYNNTMFVLDFQGKWRIFKDIEVSTMSYFFNAPYYGDALTGEVVRFLEGLSDQGDPIELDIRTKAFDGSTQYNDNEEKIKILDYVIMVCVNTGAAFDCHYSTDDGMTFNPLYDTSGNNTWSTLSDGKQVYKYLRPRYTVSIPQGRTLLLKVHNNDTKEVQVKSLKAEMFVREQPPIITG